MTYEVFRRLAIEKRFVRWLPSGVIERLSMTAGGVIMARGAFTRPHRIYGSFDYRCEEVDASICVALGEQMAAAQRTHWYEGA